MCLHVYKEIQTELLHGTTEPLKGKFPISPGEDISMTAAGNLFRQRDKTFSDYVITSPQLPGCQAPGRCCTKISLGGEASCQVCRSLSSQLCHSLSGTWEIGLEAWPPEPSSVAGTYSPTSASTGSLFLEPPWMLKPTGKPIQGLLLTWPLHNWGSESRPDVSEVPEASEQLSVVSEGQFWICGSSPSSLPLFGTNDELNLQVLIPRINRTDWYNISNVKQQL